MKKPFAMPGLMIALGTLAMSETARASFHFFDIQEVFTNNTGSVQFIELFTAAGGQQTLGGHTLTFQINTVIQQTLNLSDLPSDTMNKTFLVGTANMTVLYGITPDFIIPANFFTGGANNFLNFGEGIDRVNLTQLPADGTKSLNGLTGNSGQLSTDTSVNASATPKNFAGQTTTIPEPAVTAFGMFALGTVMLRRQR